MTIALALILGGFFGFVLQRVGAADPDKIINMLRLQDLHLMKTILAAIGVSSILLFIGLATDLLPSQHLSIKSMHWGVLVGGVLLGIGWAISGFCPGTGVVGVGTGRWDSLFFMLGGLVGAGLFMVAFERIQGTFLMDTLLGGKTTLAETGTCSSIVTGMPGWVIAIGMGVGLIGIALALPHRDASDSPTP